MLALYKEEYVEIGHLRKGHGYKGHVKIAVIEGWEDDLNDQKFIFLEMDGYKVPFFIEEKIELNEVIYKLEFINSVEELNSYLQKYVFLLKRDIRHNIKQLEKKKEKNKLLGYTINDINKGAIGVIIRIDEYPQQEMAIVKKNDKEILIPLHQELILDRNDEKKIIKMDLPEGLV